MLRLLDPNRFPGNLGDKTTADGWIIVAAESHLCDELVPFDPPHGTERVGKLILPFTATHVACELIKHKINESRGVWCYYRISVCIPVIFPVRMFFRNTFPVKSIFLCPPSLKYKRICNFSSGHSLLYHLFANDVLQTTRNIICHHPLK